MPVDRFGNDEITEPERRVAPESIRIVPTQCPRPVTVER